MIGTRIEKTNPVIINLSRERRQLGSHASVRKKTITIMHFIPSKSGTFENCHFTDG